MNDLCFGIPNLDDWFVLYLSKVHDERRGLLKLIEWFVSFLKNLMIAHDLLYMFWFYGLLIGFKLDNDGAIQEEVNNST